MAKVCLMGGFAPEGWYLERLKGKATVWELYDWEAPAGSYLEAAR